MATAAVASRAGSADYSQACRMLHFALGYAGGFVPVWIGERRELPMSFIACPESFEQVALDLSLHEKAGFAGLAEPSRFNGGPECSTVLWAWIEGGRAERYAHRFRPLPSIVLRVGATTRRLLLWLLSEPIATHLVERCNKRLSYRLRTSGALAAPEALRVPLPGTCLTAGRNRPAKITVTRATLDDHLASRIVGELRDPPPPWSPNRDR